MFWKTKTLTDPKKSGKGWLAYYDGEPYISEHGIYWYHERTAKRLPEWAKDKLYHTIQYWEARKATTL